jgi:DNA-binding MarR family transcriptional regulator
MMKKRQPPLPDTAAKPSRRELVDALNRAAREASGLGAIFAETMAARLGIGRTDLECLDVVALADNVTAGDLAKATGLTTGAITGVIDRLEKAGLVRRERDPGDRRKVYVRLTPRARRAANPYQSLGDAVDRLAARHSDAELRLITGYFTRSRDVLLAEIEKLKAR